MVDNDGFGKFIRSLRKEKRLTQMELATKLNISDKTVSKWEQGKAFPDIALWEPLASELGVGITELFNGQKAADSIEEEGDEVYIKSEIARNVKEALRRKRRKTMGVILLIGILLLFGCIGAEWAKEKTSVFVKYFVVTVKEVRKDCWLVKGEVTDSDGRTGVYYVDLKDDWYQNNPIQAQNGDKLLIVYREDWKNRTLEEETYLKNIIRVERWEDEKQAEEMKKVFCVRI